MAIQYTRLAGYQAMEAAGQILSQKARFDLEIFRTTYFVRMVLMNPHLYKDKDELVNDTAINYISCIDTVLKAGATKIRFDNDKHLIAYQINGKIHYDIYRTGLWGGNTLKDFEQDFEDLFQKDITVARIERLPMNWNGEKGTNCHSTAGRPALYDNHSRGTEKRWIPYLSTLTLPKGYEIPSINEVKDDSTDRITIPGNPCCFQEQPRTAEEETIIENIPALDDFEINEAFKQELQAQRLSTYLDNHEADITNGEKQQHSSSSSSEVHTISKATTPEPANVVNNGEQTPTINKTDTCITFYDNFTKPNRWMPTFFEAKFRAQRFVDQQYSKDAAAYIAERLARKTANETATNAMHVTCRSDNENEDDSVIELKASKNNKQSWPTIENRITDSDKNAAGQWYWWSPDPSRLPIRPWMVEDEYEAMRHIIAGISRLVDDVEENETDWKTKDGSCGHYFRCLCDLSLVFD